MKQEAGKFPAFFITKKERFDIFMKSSIYTANTSANTITLTAQQPVATIPIGATVRRFGCNLRLSGNGILADGDGYYDINTSVTATAAAAGNYTIKALADGVEIPGASQTVTAAAGSVIAFNIPAIFRLACCKSAATITLQISTDATLPADVTVNNVGVVIEKI